MLITSVDGSQHEGLCQIVSKCPDQGYFLAIDPPKSPQYCRTVGFYLYPIKKELTFLIY
jgi:hypothetical protein